jgi:hypothetical protein
MPPKRQAALSQTASQCHDRPLTGNLTGNLTGRGIRAGKTVGETAEKGRIDRADDFESVGFKPTEIGVTEIGVREISRGTAAAGLGRSACDRL